MRRFLAFLLLLAAAATARAQDEIVDVIYEINAPPTVAPSHAILSATHSDTTVAAPTDGDVLTWNAAASKWAAAASAGGGGGGAPTTATYLVETADGTLSAEFALGSLGTGLLFNTTTTGVPSIFAGTSCTNQYIRSLSAAGVATCADISTDLFWNAKGDLLVATGNNASAILPTALADDAALVSDASTATGLRWQAAPLTAAQGGTGATVPTDDNLLLGNGTVWQKKAIADCTNTAGNHLNYDASTNTFSCGTLVDAIATDTFWNAKGDLAVATANNAATLLATAANDSVLITDSTTATGLRWVSTLAAEQGGTGVTIPTDDNILVGNGTLWQKKAIADCTNTGANRLNYTASTNTFACGALTTIAATDTVWAAKGDILAGTANDTASVLSVGTNGFVLTADSAQANGVKWAATGSVGADTIWDAKGDLAGGTGADTAAKLTVGANDTALVADSAQTTGMKWQTHTLNLDTLGGTRGMLLLRGASVWAGLAKGTNGQILKSDGTDVAWHDVDEPATYSLLFDDFLGPQTTTSAGGDTGTWTVTNANSSVVSADGASLVDANHPGVIAISLGTTASGSTVITKGLSGIIIGGGEVYETMVNLNALSDGTNSYTIRAGLCDQSTAVACTDGLYFEYTHSLNSGDWSMMGASNSTRTSTGANSAGNGSDSTIAVVAATWYKLKIVVNAAATSVDYYINGTLRGTLTTAGCSCLPVSSSRFTGLEYMMKRDAGTATAFIFSIDYARFFKPLTR